MHKKNEKTEIKITDITPEGAGVGRTEDGYVLFVPGTAPGDLCECTVLKAGKSFGYAKCEAVLSASPDRRDPRCPVFGKCGGCALRHLSYEAELTLKAGWIKESFCRIGGFDIRDVEVLSTGEPDRYRNKAEYPAGTDREGKLFFGLYAPRSHRVVASPDCLLVPAFHRDIIRAAGLWCNSRGLSAYDDGRGGPVRHLYIRDARATGQISVSLIINADSVPDPDGFVSAVRSAAPGVSSVSLIINKKPGNVILGDRVVTLFGTETVTDRLCGLEFEISPLSFYQVNPAATELLYRKAAEFAGEGETLVDLYCGAGTVGLTMAGSFGRLIGVEIVPDAVRNAKKNAERNGIENAEFICSDAAEAADRFVSEGLAPDVLVVDPPRKGCSPSVVSDILRLSPERIVIICCDHATGARDAALVRAGGYRLDRICGVDMFPRTGHVETVVLITRAGVETTDQIIVN